MRRYATAIEADLLREYRLDFADWHRGTRHNGAMVLSSRRVLALLDNLTEHSRYREAFERGGNWPFWQQILKETHNEVALHRASLYAGGDNAYEATVYLDPLEQAERVAEADAETEFYEQAERELYDKLGWS